MTADESLAAAEREIVRADRLLRISQVARLTGLDVPTVRAEADAGELPCIRIGRRRDRRFQWTAVEAYCRRVGLPFAGRTITSVTSATS